MEKGQVLVMLLLESCNKSVSILLCRFHSLRKKDIKINLSVSSWILLHKNEPVWHIPLIPALGRQRQEDLLVTGQPGLQSSRTLRAIQRHSVLKKRKAETTTKPQTKPNKKNEPVSQPTCMFTTVLVSNICPLVR